MKYFLLTNSFFIIKKQKKIALLEKIKYTYQSCNYLFARHLFARTEQQIINLNTDYPDELMQEFVREGNAAIRSYNISSAAIDEEEKGETDPLRILSTRFYKQKFDALKDEIAEAVDEVRTYLLINELPFDIPIDILDEEKNMEFQYLSEHAEQQMAEAQQQLGEAHEQVEKAQKKLAQVQRQIEEAKKRSKDREIMTK